VKPHPGFFIDSLRIINILHPSLRISVIIPTYNRGWIIKEAIDSVLTQNYSDFELIVVDDGSTDDTQNILAEYKSRIRILQQDNKGVSAARNYGIDKARGDYLAFLDSDDIWLQNKITTQVNFFKQDPDSLICQTQEIWIRNGKRVNPKKYHKKYSGMIFEKTLPRCLVSPSAVMIKKSLIEEVGCFDETLPACEDYDLWLRISYRYPVHLIPKALIIKRGGHSDQLSANPGLDKYRIIALRKILETGCLTSAQYQAASEILNQKCSVYAGGCLKRGRKKEAVVYQQLARLYRLSDN